MATLLKDYLKKYQLIGDEDKQKKSIRKKRKVSTKMFRGLIIVDDNASWQKNIDEDSNEPEANGDGPQVIEDVEVKRMHQMERIKQHRPYMSIGDDGSGWSIVDRDTKDAKQTNDTLHVSSSDASPSRRDLLSLSQDISPPRKRNTCDNSPHRREIGYNISPPRRENTLDVSSPRGKITLDAFPFERIHPEDSSPPRKRKLQTDSLDMSPPRRKSSRTNSIDTSHPMKMADGRQAGLSTNKEERIFELLKKKQEDTRRLRDMNGKGQAAETVYRDKHGKRLEGLEEFLRQQQGEDKLEVKPLEWGKGLVQKREVEEQRVEFEAEKAKPFARTRDDPKLEKMYKEQVRWGDPMAHLVKKKALPAELANLGASEEMKESGFIIPQSIPKHSWLKRGVGAPMNRYGINPGRHWDGKDRSTGFESVMFKAKVEK